MKRSHGFLWVLLAGFAMVPADAKLSAESPNSPVREQDGFLILDRDDSIARALAQNRDLLSATVALETARREAANSWSVLLPSLSGGASVNHTEPLFSDPVVSQDGWSFSGSLDVSLPIQSGLVYQIRQTELDYEAQLIAWDRARMQLVNRVEQEFYYLLAAKSNLEILRTGLELAQDRYEQTRINFENGRSPEVAVLQARVSAANKEPEYLTARATYRRRLQNFLIILGIEPSQNVELRGSLETDERIFDTDALLSAYLNNRPDIRNQQSAIRSLRNNRARTVAGGQTPVLNVSAGWSTTVADPMEDSSWKQGTWTDGARIGLSLTVPLDGFIPHSETHRSIRALDDQITQAEIALDELIATAEAEILSLVDQLETSRAQIELSRLNIEYASRAYEMSEEAYNRGTMERLDVEDAQQSFQLASQSYLQSQFDYLSGLIDLRGALGLEALDELDTLSVSPSTN